MDCVAAAPTGGIAASAADNRTGRRGRPAARRRTRVRPARFADPEPVSGGGATGIMTLFDAARLSLRSGAGPFRSLGRITVIPRPYSCR